MAPFRLGFRVCDRRYPFLWSQPGQPGGRWNRPGDPPRHYLANSPLVAWAEWLRHQEIQDPEDLDGMAAALWAVLIPPDWGLETPAELAESPLVFVLWCPAERLQEEFLESKSNPCPTSVAPPRRTCRPGSHRAVPQGFLQEVP
jgi:hypothetical protein